MRPPTSGDVLANLAELLGRAATDDGLDAAVGVCVRDDGVELHLRPAAPDAHVVDALLGFDAPLDWDAIGVVAAGRAYPMNAGPARAEPVVVVHLQARFGTSTSLVGPRGGALMPMGGAAQGRVADLCRRCLGLATDPPTHSPLAWWVARWLDALCGAPALELARHDADLVDLFPGGQPFGPERSFDELEHHVRLLAQSWPWPALRAAAAAGSLAVPGLSAQDAAWLDDGSFARWATGEVPDASASSAELEHRLAPARWAGLQRLLRRWEAQPPG